MVLLNELNDIAGFLACGTIEKALGGTNSHRCCSVFMKRAQPCHLIIRIRWTECDESSNIFFNSLLLQNLGDEFVTIGCGGGSHSCSRRGVGSVTDWTTRYKYIRYTSYRQFIHMTMENSLRNSMQALDDIFRILMSPHGGLDAISSSDFASAWEGARQFRDQILIQLARHCYGAVCEGKDAFTCQDAAQRLIDFCFKFLAPRHVAFVVDLTATLVDNEQFAGAIETYAPRSLLRTPKLIQAAISGLDQSYLIDPTQLVSAQDVLSPPLPDGVHMSGSVENIFGDVVAQALVETTPLAQPPSESVRRPSAVHLMLQQKPSYTSKSFSKDDLVKMGDQIDSMNDDELRMQLSKIADVLQEQDRGDEVADK